MRDPLLLAIGALLGIVSTLISMWLAIRNGYIQTRIGRGPMK
jgi:hypothetical protein